MIAILRIARLVFDMYFQRDLRDGTDVSDAADFGNRVV
jgi:hypothetical protein